MSQVFPPRSLEVIDANIAWVGVPFFSLYQAPITHKHNIFLPSLHTTVTFPRSKFILKNSELGNRLFILFFFIYEYCNIQGLCPLTYARSVRNLKIELACLCG